MGLGALFSPKRSKPPDPIPDIKEEKTEQQEDDVPPPESLEKLAKLENANVAYPFHDVKMTSFPPPLSLDASVFTDQQNLPENKHELSFSIDKSIQENGADETEKKDEVKSDKVMILTGNGTCNSKSCTKENCSPVTCENAFKKQHESEEKINPGQLTEMINSSIKEAMQTIVKQCRMQEHKKDADKKPKKDFDNSVCYTNKEKISMKAKQYDRSRPLRSNTKPICLQEKYDNVRAICKKLHDEVPKGRIRKENVEDRRTKKHLKSTNRVKTDNRKMTGNVNIYICSEATENAQATSKQKKTPPCMETSSETTTDQSNVSSCKLVSSIRKKRRESKERDSLDFLPEREESSDNSNDCSCTSKYTDSNIANDFINACDEIVSVQDTESSLIACQCKDENASSSDMIINKLDSSLPKSKFVMCDKLEPCSTIYPSKILSSTESEKWSSKSVCSSIEKSSFGQCSDIDKEKVLCDKDRRDIWSPEPKSTSYNYYANRNSMKVCKCHKSDQELLVTCSVSNNYRSKRQKAMEKQDSIQPWSTCSCIAEEEEEDITVCQMSPMKCKRSSMNLEESTEKETEKPLNDMKEEKPELEQAEQKTVKSIEEIPTDINSNVVKVEDTEEDEMKQQKPKSPFTSPRLLRPELRALKLLLQQQGKPTAQQQFTDQNNVNSSPVKNVNIPEESVNNTNNVQTDKKAAPAFLKKFNLSDRFKPATLLAEEKTEETVPKERQNKEDQENEETKNTTEKKPRQSFLFKVMTKLVNKKERSKEQSKELVEKDKTTENTLTDTGADNKAETSEQKADAKQPSENSKIDKKENQNDKPTKADVQNTNKEKEDKKSTLGDEILKVPNITNKQTNESKETSDSGKETLSKSKLLSSIVSKKLIPPKGQDISDERRKSEKVLKELESQQVPKEFDTRESMKPEDPRKSSDQERNETESLKTPIQIETVLRKKIDTEAHPETKKEETTVCVQCNQRKSSIKMQKEASELRYMHPREREPHGVCTNAKFTKCSNVSKDVITADKRAEENRCNCCCLPISQCNNGFINYPKSCLKKGSHFSHIGSRESNLLTSHHDNRSWEECGCRRVIVCDTCCLPRNECCCRLAITCVNCCKPKVECNCKPIYNRRDSCRYMKSMFCLYCDNPREKCTCRAPMQKCSCCELSIDLCMCEDRKIFCEGRPVLTEPDNDRTMYVTAWKPREEVRRYFSRNLESRRADSINECCCYEKLMPHNSDDLPYQRLSVFSDVMDELQKKMSESSCTQCRKIPCCCNVKVDKEEGREERKMKYCVSPKTRRKVVAVCMEKSKGKPPNICCKCDSAPARSEKPKKIIIPLCCACQMTPCRCKKSKSGQKKPKAKCYYCKTSPCVCITARERSKSRPCRCADSPCRTKEKEITLCGKTSTKPKNNEEKIICVR